MKSGGKSSNARNVGQISMSPCFLAISWAVPQPIISVTTKIIFVEYIGPQCEHIRTKIVTINERGDGQTRVPRVNIEISL